MVNTEKTLCVKKFTDKNNIYYYNKQYLSHFEKMKSLKNSL